MKTIAVLLLTTLLVIRNHFTDLLKCSFQNQGQLVENWEKTAKELKRKDVRLVIVRTGIVLGPNGGALQPLVTTFKVRIKQKKTKKNDFVTIIVAPKNHH